LLEVEKMILVLLWELVVEDEDLDDALDEALEVGG